MATATGQNARTDSNSLNPKGGAPGTVASTGNDHFVRLSRKVALHRMDTAESLEDRVWWAIILLSVCGPMVSDYAVVKDEKGFIQNSNGVPIPATLTTILEVLGLAPGMKGHVSRAVKSLTQKNSVRYESRLLYPVKEPARPDPQTLPVHGNVSIAGIVVDTGNIPLEGQARQSYLEALGNLSTKWRTGLKTLKYDIQGELVLLHSSFGIIIEKRKKSRREKPPASQPNVKVEEVREPEPKPAGRPQYLEGQSPKTNAPEPPLKAGIRQHLETIPIPRLTDDVVNEVAKHITSAGLLQQYKEETAPHRVRPQKWVLLIRIAAQVGADGERYAKAAAASSESPPLTPLQRKAADYARRRKEANGANSS